MNRRHLALTMFLGGLATFFGAASAQAYTASSSWAPPDLRGGVRVYGYSGKPYYWDKATCFFNYYGAASNNGTCSGTTRWEVFPTLPWSITSYGANVTIGGYGPTTSALQCFATTASTTSASSTIYFTASVTFDPFDSLRAVEIPRLTGIDDGAGIEVACDTTSGARVNNVQVFPLEHY